MITRTIISKKITVSVYNLETDTKELKIFTDMTLAAIRKAVEGDGKFKLLTVDNTESIEKMYGMDYDTFIKNSVELDPKTRKPIIEK